MPVEFSFHPDRRREVLETVCPDAVFTGSHSDLLAEFITLDTVGIALGRK